MDRGAARSRKRSQIQHKLPRPEDEAGSSSQRNGGPHPAQEGRSQGVHPSRQKRPGAVAYDPLQRALQRGERPPRPRKQLLDEATRYKPKAIRSAAALIWSEAPFALPPPKDVLSGVRRIDLAGSGVTDVTWLQGCGVTWLSLAGCEIKQGWEAVGSLKELSVLNISNCGLKQLPSHLSTLANLKAVVAMSNDWSNLDESVIGEWKELNSFIVSHSPNLASIPQCLAQLYHLSKLTFSHCPNLSAASLPDLSALPSLRDVKMNNLPLLTSLPSHLASWGTGDLSLLHHSRSDTGIDKAGETSAKRYGEGLEVLDLGNCSLPFTAIEPVFIRPKSAATSKGSFSHLRSLTLHSNPLTITHPTYVELLQASEALPNLQIIDSRRVRERKRKGEISESRKDKAAREKRAAKMKPSGANVGGTTTMRRWGAETTEAEQAKKEAEGDHAVTASADQSDSGRSAKKRKVQSSETDRGPQEKSGVVKKRKKGEDVESRKQKADNKGKVQAKTSTLIERHRPHAPADANGPPPMSLDAASDPSLSIPPAPAAAQAKSSAKPMNSTSKEPVYQVIDVSKVNVRQPDKANAKAGEEGISRADRRIKKRKEKAERGPTTVQEAQVVKSGPVDLKSIFGSKTGDVGDREDGIGLGVSGW